MAEEHELYAGSSQSRPIDRKWRFWRLLLCTAVCGNATAVWLNSSRPKQKSGIGFFKFPKQRIPSLENHGSEYCHSTVEIEKEEMI